MTLREHDGPGRFIKVPTRALFNPVFVGSDGTFTAVFEHGAVT